MIWTCVLTDLKRLTRRSSHRRARSQSRSRPYQPYSIGPSSYTIHTFFLLVLEFTPGPSYVASSFATNIIIYRTGWVDWLKSQPALLYARTQSSLGPGTYQPPAPWLGLAWRPRNPCWDGLWDSGFHHKPVCQVLHRQISRQVKPKGGRTEHRDCDRSESVRGLRNFTCYQS